MAYKLCGVHIIDVDSTDDPRLQGLQCLLPVGHSAVEHLFGDPRMPSGQIVLAGIDEQVAKVHDLYVALTNIMESYKLSIREHGNCRPENVTVVRQAEATLQRLRKED